MKVLRKILGVIVLLMTIFAAAGGAAAVLQKQGDMPQVAQLQPYLAKAVEAQWWLIGVCGAVAPSTLVTRWFRANRGRALGIAATPALLAAMPLPAVYMMRQGGLAPVYWLFAGMMLLLFAASALVRDHPPAGQASAVSKPPA